MSAVRARQSAAEHTILSLQNSVSNMHGIRDEASAWFDNDSIETPLFSPVVDGIVRPAS